MFRAGDLWVHKTFHIYTVRAKQGGSQGSADNTSRTSRGSGPSRWPPVTSSSTAPPPPT
ncbi:MAG: hypothetical protein GY823_08425 [Flavobacteriaceae bacterium]|nr:hypothetical protein [Flavobacteriaceae bacterium]